MLLADQLFWPQWLVPVLGWMATNQIGDVAALVGIVVSVSGFIITILKLIKSQRAAEAAATAANETRKSMEYVTALTDLASGIAIMEEIRRFHRAGVIQPLPDRYAELRKILIVARAWRGDLVGSSGLSVEQKATIQSALANLSKAEESVERSNAKQEPVDFVRLNKILSKDLDQLHEILVHLKSLAGGR